MFVNIYIDSDCAFTKNYQTRTRLLFLRSKFLKSRGSKFRRFSSFVWQQVVSAPPPNVRPQICSTLASFGPSSVRPDIINWGSFNKCVCYCYFFFNGVVPHCRHQSFNQLRLFSVHVILDCFTPPSKIFTKLFDNLTGPNCL